MYEKEKNRIKEIVKNQENWRKFECINLIASENVTSEIVDGVYKSDFSHRYAEGDPYKRYYQGTKYIDEAESLAMRMIGKLFRAKQVSLKPISGTIANIAALDMFASSGDSIMTTSMPFGGHISVARRGGAGVLGLCVTHFQPTEDFFHIDVDKTIKVIENTKRLSALIFGCTLFLFPQPVKEISKIAKNRGIKIIYDASHVLGLIAGREFQDPLREGADIITSSTHKTFFGPQGGLILSNMPNKEWKRDKLSIFPGTISNHHLHRIPALSMAALEFMTFGNDYAKNVIKNAKTLAEVLYNNGLNVCAEKFGFTKSHQMAIDVKKLGGGKVVAEKLEKNNIIVNKNLLPWDSADFKTLQNPSGIRIGVQEMTRWGAKSDDMAEIGKLIKKAISGKDVKKDVIEFRKNFQEVRYTFKN